jgi:DNA invertase Pin-like site-specific DNA recombinase
MTNVFAYYRVSTDKQVKANTIENQVKLVREFAVAINVDIVKEFYEPGESGADRERKQYHEMIAALDQVDGIIVYQVSRLARDRRFSQMLAWDMEDKNKILYIAEDRSVNDFKEMIVRIKFNLMSEIADDYRRETKARQIVGIQRKRAANGGLWGRRPAKVNWRMYDDLKSKGLSDHAISKVLNMDWRTLRKNIRDRNNNM